MTEASSQPETGTCARCAPLRKRLGITLPVDLSEAIRVARHHIAQGDIVEVPQSSPYFSSEPFSQISLDGPWDDIVGYYFRCTSCGQLFSLSCEVYHGRGGEWRPVARL